MARNGSIHDLLDPTAPLPYSFDDPSHEDPQHHLQHTEIHPINYRTKQPLQYAPINRISPPSSVLYPISKLELIQCETTINPLRMNPKVSNSEYYDDGRYDDPTTSAVVVVASTSGAGGGGGGRESDKSEFDGNGNAKGKHASLPNRPLTVKERLREKWQSDNGGGGGGGNERGNERGTEGNHSFSGSSVQSQIQGVHQPKRHREEDDPAYKRRRQNQDVFAVQSHYNARPNIDRSARMNSPIIGLKNFNNWIKSVLIGKFSIGAAPPDKPQENNNNNNNRNSSHNSEPRYPGKKLKVLDLGCGKGGDLQKWSKAGTEEYIAFDLAAVSVEQARSRWQEMRGDNKFKAAFFALDCFEESIGTILQETHVDRPFDVVTMQFCLHYAFESEAKARMMLSNVVRYLRVDGTLIATIPDDGKLLHRLEDLDPNQDLSFGNEVYKITFDEQSPLPRFGHRYTFFLQDAVEEVPEYVVYWDQLTNLAEEYGLECQFKSDFREIFVQERNDPQFASLLTRMKVVDSNGDTEMSMDQWEACNLYVGVVFKKVRQVDLEALALITEMNAR